MVFIFPKLFNRLFLNLCMLFLLFPAVLKGKKMTGHITSTANYFPPSLTGALKKLGRHSNITLSRETNGHLMRVSEQVALWCIPLCDNINKRSYRHTKIYSYTAALWCMPLCRLKTNKKHN